MRGACRAGRGPAAPPEIDQRAYRRKLRGPYRDDLGPITVAMDELSVFLRDHHSGERIAIDVGVLDFLAGVMDAVGATKATVLSAYRTRETNAMLARTTFGVADNSQHIYGRALDIRLDSRHRGCDAGGADDAARRRRLVSPLGVFPPRQRAGAQLDARRRRASTGSCWNSAGSSRAGIWRSRQRDSCSCRAPAISSQCSSGCRCSGR